MDPLIRLNRFLDAYLTPAVKTILLINVGVFIFFLLVQLLNLDRLASVLLGLLMITPGLALGRLLIWQFVSYMFIHLEPFHLLFNMIILWFFAPELERRWGTIRFWYFYLFAGVVGAVAYAVLTLVFRFPPGPGVPVIGASGALFGVMLAFACYYPNQQVYFMGIFPIMIKYLVPIIMIFEVLSLGTASRVSNLMHLTGLASAYVYLWRYHHTPDVTRWRFMR